MVSVCNPQVATALCGQRSVKQSIRKNEFMFLCKGNNVNGYIEALEGCWSLVYLELE